MIKIKERVKYFVKIHKELHGNKYDWIDIHKDIISKYPDYDSYEIMDEIGKQWEIIKNENKKYGLFIGRCMPFTNAHSAIIQEIIRDGRIPIIILGGKGKTDERHPLSYEDRVKLIKKVYPFGCKFIGIEDKDDWTEWYNSVHNEIDKLNILSKQIVLYAHEKEMDKVSFEYRGKEYKNASYVDMFRENGIKIKEIEAITCTYGDIIHATDVRKDEDIAKRNLDARIYRTLKDKYGWWK